MPPKVSINLCCYNGEKHLEETLQSIASQTYRDWELIVVNDGSTDSTEQIVQKYRAKGLPIIYHYQMNAGVGNARNRALQLSSGDYIAFIDQDDIWLPEKLEKQVPLFDDEKVGLVFSDAMYFNHSGRQVRLYRNRMMPTGNIFRDLLAGYFLCLSTVVIARRTLDSLVEHFDEKFEILEEADLFCRIAYSWACKYVPQPLVRYRVHRDSASWVKLGLAPRETEYLVEKYGRTFPDFERRFSREVGVLRDAIQYEYAKSELLKGCHRNGRSRLRTIVFRDTQFAVLFLLAFAPKSALRFLIGLKKILPSR